MSTATKKPAAGTAGPRRSPSTEPTSASPARGPARSPAPSTVAPNGLARTRSLRGGSPLSARGTMARSGPGASNLNNSSAADNADEDARAETVALLDELKERLRNTETEREHYQKQSQILQLRLDESLQEAGKLEDKLHENEEKLEALESEKRDAMRQKREMEAIYEAERSSMNKEREDSSSREEEMQTIIQRLKDSLTQRSFADEESRISRRCKLVIFLHDL